MKSAAFKKLLADVNQRMRKSRNYRVCLHPSAPIECSSEIISAHTVQRCGGGLSSIARGNHVYGSEPDMFQLDASVGQVELKLLGIHRASTFSGFCGGHDAALFKAVETQPFVGSPEQVAALTFRSVARETWEKRVKMRSHEIMRHVMNERGIDPVGELVLSSVTDADRLDLQRVEEVKLQMDRIVTQSDWAALASVVIWTDGVPPVLASGLTYAQYDFEGRELQDFESEKPLEGVAVNSIATGAGTGAIIFSWLAVDTAPAHLAASLLSQADSHLASAAVRFVVEHIENLYVAPQWWEKCSPEEQSLFLQHMNAGLPPLRPHGHRWYDPSSKLDLGVAPTGVSK